MAKFVGHIGTEVSSACSQLNNYTAAGAAISTAGIAIGHVRDSVAVEVSDHNAGRALEIWVIHDIIEGPRSRRIPFHVEADSATGERRYTKQEKTSKQRGDTHTELLKEERRAAWTPLLIPKLPPTLAPVHQVVFQAFSLV